MKITNIHSLYNQNFGMPIEKNSVLDSVRKSYERLGRSIDETSSPEFINKVCEMLDAFDYLERSSKGVKVYVLPEKTNFPFPKCSLFCEKDKKAIKVDLPEIFYPFFKAEDIFKMAIFVNFMKLFL